MLQNTSTKALEKTNQSSTSSSALVSRIPKNFGIGQTFTKPEEPGINSPTLECLPLLPLQMILDKLDDESISHLNRAFSNYRLFKFSREEEIKRAQPLANEACQLIARGLYVIGDEAKLHQLLKFRFIFMLKASVTTPSGRVVDNVTPYECALREGDPELANIIGDKMDAVGLQEERIRQYQNVFPENAIEQPAFDFSEVEQAINDCTDDGNDQNPDLRAAINHQNNNSALIQALTKFRNDYEVHVKAEKVVNYHHILRAWDIYDSNFGQWSFSQKRVWWILVHGLTLKLSSARMAQNFLFGIGKIVDSGFTTTSTRTIDILVRFFHTNLALHLSFGVLGTRLRVNGPMAGGWAVGRPGDCALYFKPYLEHTHELTEHLQHRLDSKTVQKQMTG